LRLVRQKFVSQTNTIKLFGFFDTLVEQDDHIASDASVLRSFTLSARDRNALLARLERGISVFSSANANVNGRYVRTDSGTSASSMSAR